jgi:hypothetical protein
LGTDYIYWTFSAAAQSISAFVAFLLTGYALVHTLMEAARERDDSLDEVHGELKSTYYRHLRELAWLTGAAVTLSLVVVYANRSNNPAPNAALILVAIVDLGAIVGALAFVVSIIDPRKYQKAAERVLEQIPGSADIKVDVVPAKEFFGAFLHLERLVRDYLKNRDLYVPSRGAPRMSYSFRQMIEALLQNEVIDRSFFDELLDISKYRNLVFHGHVDNVEPGMIRRARSASEHIEDLGARDTLA